MSTDAFRGGKGSVVDYFGFRSKRQRERNLFLRTEFLNVLIHTIWRIRTVFTLFLLISKYKELDF